MLVQELHKTYLPEGQTEHLHTQAILYRFKANTFSVCSQVTQNIIMWERGNALTYKRK
jgi:hypothetical protein